MKTFIKTTQQNKNRNYRFLFSHNINGETHPCGCRNFPLGGIPQAYGIINSQREKSPLIYVDSGDTFFPSPTVPAFLDKSSRFTAHKIAEALDKAGLRYMTPGDQDFALGEDFLISLTKRYSFEFIITNASKKLKLKHLKRAMVETQNFKFYFLGITHPELHKSSDMGLFTNPIESLKSEIKSIKKEVGKSSHKIILLSHSGLDNDKIIAKKLPELDWIIGAHSQSYLRYSEDVGNTKLVQVLSRNHFLGHLTFDVNRSKTPATYKIIESREETKDLIKDNPMTAWLSSYKSELNKIQEEEQLASTVQADHKYLPTFISCSECHQKQTDFWQGTAHSLAFKTLIDAKASMTLHVSVVTQLVTKKKVGLSVLKKSLSAKKKNLI